MLALLFVFALLLFGRFFLRQFALFLGLFLLALAPFLLFFAALFFFFALALGFFLGPGQLACLVLFFLLLGEGDLGVARFIHLGLGLRFGRWRWWHDALDRRWRRRRRLGGRFGRRGLRRRRPQLGFHRVFGGFVLPVQAPGQRQDQQQVGDQRQRERTANAALRRWGEFVALGGAGVHGRRPYFTDRPTRCTPASRSCFIMVMTCW